MDQPDLLCTALALNIELCVRRFRDVILEFRLNTNIPFES